MSKWFGVFPAQKAQTGGTREKENAQRTTKIRKQVQVCAQYLQGAQRFMQIAFRTGNTRQHNSAAVSPQGILQKTRQFRLAIGHVLEGAVGGQCTNNLAQR